MIILIKFLWHSNLRDSLNNNIKFIFSVALKLTAGIQFNRSIDFNGIQQDLEKTSTVYEWQQHQRSRTPVTAFPT